MTSYRFPLRRLGLTLASSWTLAGCAPAPLLGAPAQPGSTAVPTPAVPTATPSAAATASPASGGGSSQATFALSGVASRQGKGLAGGSVQVFDALSGQSLAGQAAADAQGRFQVQLPGLAAGQAVRVVVSDAKSSVEAVVLGQHGPASLTLDESSTARSLLVSGLLDAEAALTGAKGKSGMAPAPGEAIAKAQQAIDALDWNDALQVVPASAQALVAAGATGRSQTLAHLVDQGGLTKQVRSAVITGLVAMVGEVQTAHAQAGAPLAAAVPLTGTTLALQPGAGADAVAGLSLLDTQTGQKADLANAASLIDGVSHGSGGGGSSGAVVLSLAGLDYANGSPGRVVHLVGTGFSTDPTQDVVTFNGVPATVSAATSTRLTVQVPAVPQASTTVALSVNGQATATQPFTVFQHPTEMSSLASEDPSLTLVEKRGDAAAVVDPQDPTHVYLVGGYDPAINPLATTEMATVKQGVSATAGYHFTGSTEAGMPSLHTARYGASAAIVGRRLYVFGGRVDSTSLASSFEYADIQANGTLTTFTAVDTSGTPLLQRAREACLVTSGAVYLIGGESATHSQAAGFGAVKVPTGAATASGIDLAALAEVSVDPALDRTSVAFAQLGNAGFLAGGYDGAGAETTAVVRVDVDGSGNLTATTLPQALNNQRAEAAAVIVGGKLYVMGGYGNGLFPPPWESSTIDTSGATPALASFVTGAPADNSEYPTLLPFGDGTIFAFGGFPAMGPVTNAVTKAELYDPTP